jgi:hypothetical protein
MRRNSNLRKIQAAQYRTEWDTLHSSTLEITPRRSNRQWQISELRQLVSM